MQMVYNSDQYVVVAFEMPDTQESTSPADAAQGGHVPTLARGGFEIIDKHARREIFIEGALAESFQQGVQALVAESGDDQEGLDEFIGRYTLLAQQPLTLH